MKTHKAVGLKTSTRRFKCGGPAKAIANDNNFFTVRSAVYTGINGGGNARSELVTVFISSPCLSSVIITVLKFGIYPEQIHGNGIKAKIRQHFCT